MERSKEVNMRYVVYADVLFVHHVVMNLFLFLMLQTILGHTVRIGSTLLVSVLIAFLSTGIFVLTTDSCTLYYIVYATSCFFMTYFFAYRNGKSCSVPAVLLVMIAVCIWLAGLMQLFHVSAGRSLDNPRFYAACVVSLLGCRYGRRVYDRRKCAAMEYEVNLAFASGSLCASAFLDTGNHLYNPYTAKPAILLSYRALKPYVSGDGQNELERYHQTGQFAYTQMNERETITFFPLPYHTISDRFSMMPAITLERLTYTKEHTSYTTVTAGISREAFFDNHFDVLLHEKLKP